MGLGPKDSLRTPPLPALSREGFRQVRRLLPLSLDHNKDLVSTGLLHVT